MSLDEFLMQFQPAMQQKLRSFVERPDIVALVAIKQPDGRLIAQAFDEVPEAWPDDVASIYCKVHLPDDDDDVKSKTMQALELVADGMTAYAAAQKLGISQSVISRALSRREGKKLCPCCAQVVREGYKIDKSVLKD